MRNHTTLWLLALLAGALLLYLARRPSPLRAPSQPQRPHSSPLRAPSQPQRSHSSPRRDASSTTPQRPASRVRPASAVTPTTRATRSLQRRFRALRQRILDPRQGWIHQRRLLPPQEVQRLLGLRSPLQMLFLQGIPRTPRYDAVQYVPTSPRKEQSYLLGLQIWLAPPSQLQRRWRQQLATYPNARRTSRPLAGRATFWAHRAPLHYLHVRTSTALISLSCRERVCTSRDVLKPLAQRLARRLP